MRNYLKERGCNLFKMLSLHLSAGTEKNEEKLTQDNRYPGKDSKGVPSKYK
jgi:hypothetical protein